jgi:hypothetical protein
MGNPLLAGNTRNMYQSFTGKPRRMTTHRKFLIIAQGKCTEGVEVELKFLLLF